MAHAYYLSFFDKQDRNKIIDSFNIWINSPKTPKFDAIAVSGLSGLTFGPLLAHLNQKELIAIRKQDDTSNHSNRIVETVYRPSSKFRYIILDDLISSAATVYYIREVLNKFLKKSKLVGMWRYDIREPVKMKFLADQIKKLGEYFPSRKQKIDDFVLGCEFNSCTNKYNC
jgi:hypothetical protein